MDMEKTIEFLIQNQAAHDERLTRLENVTTTLVTVVGTLADHVNRLDGVITNLAESHIRLVERMDTLAQRMDTIAQESNERDKKLGTRIDNLVSAIGEFIRNRPVTG